MPHDSDRQEIMIMGTHTVMTHAPKQGPVSLPLPAAPGTPCGVRCYGTDPAIHVLTESLPVAPAGTALCAYHSPFDRDSVAPVAQSDAEWLATPSVLASGVSLVKATDGTPATPAPGVDPLRAALPMGAYEELGANDPNALDFAFRWLIRFPA